MTVFRSIVVLGTSHRIHGSDLFPTRNEPALQSPAAGHPDSVRSKELTLPIAVTIKQAARLLCTNDKQIRRGVYARELPVVRFGNSYSIAVDDLKAWFNRKKGVL
jgi:excisionase family DNA binding protein